MVTPMELVRLLVRQDDGAEAPIACASGNDYNGRMGLRISSIFVIFIGSLLGAVFPTYAKRHQGLGVPDWAFFVAKYFGSGVIIATAFIHLLAPANEALGDECLTGVIASYPWPEGIALMTIMLMFFLELMTMRYATFGGEHSHGHDHNHSPTPPLPQLGTGHDSISLEAGLKQGSEGSSSNLPDHRHPNAPGEDHLGHGRQHTDNNAIVEDWDVRGIVPESYAAQMTAIFILEFGVIFHSIFIGLTLAVSGEEFITLYIVLVFHQTFEGLGLGARLACVPWPRTKRWTPYLLGLGYAFSTPIAIAVGLGIRESYPSGSRTTLISNGVFDSISAGILIYTGLVELMAHEFMFSPYMQKAPIGRVLSAFFLMCLGAGLMSVLGYWA